MAFTYVNVYVFRLTSGYGKPAFYQLVSNACIPLGFAIAAFIARRASSATAYRIGLLSHQAFVILLILLAEHSIDWLGCLGVASGLATGIYWQGWILMIVDLSSDKERDAMLGSQQSVYFVAGLSATPLAGWFLSRFSGVGGYGWVFGLALAFFGLAYYLSLPLKTRSLHGSSSLWRLVRARKPEGWWAMLHSSVWMGLLSVSTMFLGILLSFDSTGTEKGTGGYTFLNAALGFGAAAYIARHGKPSNRLKTLWLAATAIALVTLPLAFSRSYPMVLLYGAGMAIAMSFYNVPLFSTHLRIISDHRHFHARRPDALMMRETAIGLGRIIGYGFIWLAVRNVDSRSLGLFFIVIALSQFLNTLAIRRHV